MNMDLQNIENEKELNFWLHKELGIERFKRGEDRLRSMLSKKIAFIQNMGVKIITIAGTNGKGETSYSLSHLLQREKIRHVLWISPHVYSIRERISADGDLISFADLKKLAGNVYQEMQKKKLGLSYYEFLFCILVEFILQQQAKSPLQALILEVGIGGRLDAVNLFDANLAAITSISRDHEDLLGIGYANILNEKLGIARSNGFLITSLELAYLRDRVKARKLPTCDLFSLGLLKKSDSFSRRNRFLALSLFLAMKSQIQGQEFNAKHLTLKLLEEIVDEISFPIFKGRNEEMTIKERRFIFIGSHNLDGIRKLVERAKLKGDLPYEAALVALSNRSYKGEEKSILKIFASETTRHYLATKVYVSEFDHSKALKLSSDSFQNEIKKLNHLEWVNDWKKLLSDEGFTAKTILVTGSFYFVGTVQAFLLEHYPS